MSDTATSTDTTSTGITGTGVTKLTAAQIEKGCPARLQAIGQEITARLAKADKKTQEANDHLIAVNQLLAEAKRLCDSGGFQKFRELFCPQLGKSQAYAMLAIAAGRKTIEQHRSEERERKQKTRERQKAATNSGTVPEKLQPLNQSDANVVAGISAPPTFESSTLIPEAVEPTVEEAEAEVARLKALKAKIAAADDTKIEPAVSADALSNFRHACEAWLPKMNADDLQAAIDHCRSGRGSSHRANTRSKQLAA
jgi:uncharacterized Zn finger protein (UPF0148 family)